MGLQTFTFLFITCYCIGNCEATIPMPDYRGDNNVMDWLGFNPRGLAPANHYYRLNENCNNSDLRFVEKVSMNSFAFESILRWDEAIKSSMILHRQKFVLFSFGKLDPEDEAIFEISLDGTSSQTNKNKINIRILTDSGNYENIFFSENEYSLSDNDWHKILLTYRNGIIKLWVDCIPFQSLKPNHSFPGLKFTVYFDHSSQNFPFSVGYFKGPGDANNNTFGDFDIVKMNFYNGYLRPSELNCCDVPQLCKR